MNSKSGIISSEGSPVEGRFLVIGCGSIGKRHLRNLRKLGITDILAFDVRADRRKEVEEQIGVETHSDLGYAFDQQPSVVFVCSPTHLHLEHALLAARSGCHIFIEKPIATKLDGLEELIHVIDERQLHTLVGCNFRFHPGMRHAKELLEQGIIGRVISARVQFGQYLPDWHPWEDYRQSYSANSRMGGGVLLDRIHEFDYLRWLLGEITEVSAFIAHLSHLDIDTEDIAEILVRFEDGAIGSVHLDYVRRRYDCGLEIVGDMGIIQWSYQDHLIRWYSVDDNSWHSLEWPEYDGNTMYLAEIDHFLDVLAGQKKSEQDISSAMRVLSVVLACKRSASEQRTVKI